MNAQETINEFKSNVSKFHGGEVLAKGAITGILERACGSAANRYLVLKVLTGKTSSKLLDEAEWYGLLCLVQPEKPTGGRWQSARGDDLRVACHQLLTEAVSRPGQMKMTL